MQEVAAPRVEPVSPNICLSLLLAEVTENFLPVVLLLLSCLSVRSSLRFVPVTSRRHLALPISRLKECVCV